MLWTTKLPEKSDYYWYRDDAESGLEIVFLDPSLPVIWNITGPKFKGAITGEFWPEPIAPPPTCGTIP